jgi:hypothetical protein
MDEKKLAQAKAAFDEYKKTKKEIIDNNLTLPRAKTQKYYYPLTQFLLRMITLFGGESISFLNEKKIVTPKGRPIIFSNTHKFKPDIEKTTISINKPSAFMASDFINSYKNINGWYFGTRPTVFVDPYDKVDKNYSYKMMVRFLKEGYNFMIYPEAVWNLSENKIILGTFLGTVKAALETNAVIVCTAIERYGKKYIINRKGYFDPVLIMKQYTDKTFEELSNCSEHTDLLKNILIECNNELRDTMATLTFEIWEDHANNFGIESRKDLPKDYWESFVSSLTAEWPGYKMSDNVEQRYHSKAELEQEQIESDLSNIRPTMQNAFLFNKRLK